MNRSFGVPDALTRPSRRAFLSAAGGLVAWSHLPSFARAGGRDPRLIVIILRGALDGLALAPPVGDPDYASLRGDLALGLPGVSQVLRLDGFFGLNDAMPALHASYQAGHALL